MTCQSKNPRYKSTVEFYNNASQTLTTTPSPISLGIVVTNTGVALTPNTSNVEVSYPGTFLINIDAIFESTTAGDVTLQVYLNETALPETLRTVTIPVGFTEVSINTVRFIRPDCQNPSTITVYAKYTNTDGTAAGSINLISGNVVKLA